jgi:hypothetical protein
MGVVNRRNAILGWAVWTASKRMAKQKAKSAVREDGARLPNKSAMAAAVAAVSGAVWFWRRRAASDDED